MFILVLWLSIIGNLSDIVQCEYSQASIENEVENKLRETINTLENDDNALRELRVVDQYIADMKEILCIGDTLIFEGRVWSIDFGSESFILRLGSNKGGTFFPFFYNYEFLDDDPLANKIAELSKGDDVSFEFTFIDTFSSDSEVNRGIPLTDNPDTGNSAIMLYVDLIDIGKAIPFR